LEGLVSLEVQMVKILISNSRHVVWYKGRSLRVGEQQNGSRILISDHKL
jgi:hypothetical protein